MLKRKLAWILVFIMLFSAYSAPAAEVSAAQTGASKSAGADSKKYSKTVTITVDTSNFSRSFYLALKEAEAKASSSVRYKIIIPPGNYIADHLYRVPSNTCIYARGAVIDLVEERACLLMSNPSGHTQNIKIDGGTWSTLKQSTSFSPGSSIIRMMGVDNLILKNMTIRTKRWGHMLELADINGLTVSGCTFWGNGTDSSNTPASVQPKEAIQLDVALTSAMPSFTTVNKMYNGRGCHDVLITKNTFKNCARGVGSHSGTSGTESKPYTNIAVTSNTFKNLIGEAVFAQDWRYCTISGNKINKCRQCGIYLLDAFQNRIEKNQINDVRRYTGARKSTYDPKGVYGVGILLRRSSGNVIKSNTVSKYYREVVLNESANKNTIKNNKGTKKIK